MSRKHSALLQSKLDTSFTQYHNKVQDMEAKKDEVIRKNKALRQKNKGMTLVVAARVLILLISTSNNVDEVCAKLEVALQQVKVPRQISKILCTGRLVLER
jgi:hypothetical protein